MNTDGEPSGAIIAAGDPCAEFLGSWTVTSVCGVGPSGTAGDRLSTDDRDAGGLFVCLLSLHTD